MKCSHSLQTTGAVKYQKHTYSTEIVKNGIILMSNIENVDNNPERFQGRSWNRLDQKGKEFQLQLSLVVELQTKW